MLQAAIDQTHSKANNNLSQYVHDVSASSIVEETLFKFDKITNQLIGMKNAIEKSMDGVEPRRVPVRPEVAALKIIQARAAAGRVFDDLAMSDGHYIDILLDLFASEAMNRNVSVTDACLASRSPATTALRWIGLLEKEELIQKRNDPTDQRRSLLTLTPKGKTITLQCIEAFSFIR